MARALSVDPMRLIGLWADTVQVHALFLDEARMTAHLASVPVEDGQYLALSPVRPGSAWAERMIHDLWGHRAEGAGDERPWLDHGHWPLTHPLSPRPGPAPTEADPPEFLPGSGMQLPLGPITGLIDPSIHRRLTVQGARVGRAESRLGYAHKGTLALMRGKSPRTAARFAARIAADATVAHSIAFARAAEAALGAEAPPRAVWLRALMGEVERATSHLSGLERLAEAIGLPRLAMACLMQRERLAWASETAFGHRLLMDVAVPGGLSHDISPDGHVAFVTVLESVTDGVDGLWRHVEAPGAATRLVGIAATPHPLLAAFGVAGVAGRAAGGAYDARMFEPLFLDLEHVSETDRGADAAARARVRLGEIQASLRHVRALLRGLPDGPVGVVLPNASGEGIGCAEAARGDVWHWVRLDHGQIAAAFPVDPGWGLGPLADRLCNGADPADLPVILASLGVTASGTDL